MGDLEGDESEAVVNYIAKEIQLLHLAKKIIDFACNDHQAVLAKKNFFDSPLEISSNLKFSPDCNRRGHS